MSEQEMLYTPLELLLGDGEYHSGPALAEVLGLSRTAVWKQLNQLKKLGVVIQSSHSLGYRIEGGLDLLSAATIIDNVSDFNVSCAIERSVSSTNDAIKSRVDFNDSSAAAYFIAEYQTQGRGRQGKTWHMPLGAGLCFSTSLTLTQGVRQAQGLSLVVGIAIVDALSSLGVAGLSVKWPNDIWLNGKKLGGVLIELSGDVMGQAHAVIGIGLNNRLPPLNDFLDEECAAQMQERVADLFAGGYVLSRNDIMTQLIVSIEKAKAEFLDKGFASFYSRWQDTDGLFECPVTIHQPIGVCSGVAKGIDENGGLRVLIDDEMRVFYGGDVSPRLV